MGFIDCVPARSFNAERSDWKSIILGAPTKIIYGAHNILIMLLPFRLRRYVHYGERYIIKFGRHAILRGYRLAREKLSGSSPEADIAMDDLSCTCEGGQRIECWACVKAVCDVSLRGLRSKPQLRISVDLLSYPPMSPYNHFISPRNMPSILCNVLPGPDTIEFVSGYVLLS